MDDWEHAKKLHTFDPSDLLPEERSAYAEKQANLDSDGLTALLTAILCELPPGEEGSIIIPG